MSKKKDKKRNKTRAEPTSVWMCSPDAFEILSCQGYTSLAHNPEILSGVKRIADLVGSMTFHLMENTEK